MRPPFDVPPTRTRSTSTLGSWLEGPAGEPRVSMIWLTKPTSSRYWVASASSELFCAQPGDGVRPSSQWPWPEGDIGLPRSDRPDGWTSTKPVGALVVTFDGVHLLSDASLKIFGGIGMQIPPTSVHEYVYLHESVF